jgi:peptide/nickel transport system substrate-binding protein
MTPFTGTSTGYVYPKHVLEGGREAHDAFLSAPIGTGPFVVESFTPNDQVIYIANENYREPNKPYFSRIQLKGGGDPASAARSVLQTGEFHYAWYLQTETSVLESLESEDGPGRVIPYPGATVERININFSDPHTEVDGQRSEMNTPHPFLTDPAVREAMATAIDRQLILDELYGEDMSVAVNILQGDPTVYSPNTSWEYNPAEAAQILEDAGWVLDGDVRAKDGVRLEMTYATETNPLSQKTQAIVKSNLDAVGFSVQIEQIDPGVFYDGSAGNDQNLSHFYWDLNMFKSVPSGPRPISFMETWYAGPNGENIAQASNDWTGGNIQRWKSEEYDALFESAQVEPDPDKLIDIFIGMNDIVILEHVIIPLILVGTPRGMSRQLRYENIQLAPFSYDYWNIANWNFAE